MICGVATNNDVSNIWADIAAAPTKREGLATLVQYLMSGMTVCCHKFLGHADILHINIALYNFAVGNHFVNPGDNLVYPAGSLTMWAYFQGYGDVCAWIAAADSDMTALSGCNTQANQINRASKVHLAPISGAHTLR